MAAEPFPAVVRFLDTVRAQGAAGHADADLLARFVALREPAALEALIRRHGTMVFGVCRRLLGTGPDAEDAFQATFLILARKAAAIRKHQAVGSWLHGVALRLSQQARGKLAQRRRRETTLDPNAEVLLMDADPGHQASLRELCAILDEEVQSLPAKYRAAIVACHLENRSTTEAAKHLGIPPSTLKSQLERGRDLLRGRLSRRGVGLSAVALAAWLTDNGRCLASPVLIRTTVEAAMTFVAGGASAVSAQVASLAAKGLKATALVKFKVAVVATFAIGALGLAASVSTLPGPVAEGSAHVADGPPQLAKNNSQPPIVKKDLHGDPLPPGAIARLGTMRWRHDGVPNFIAILPDGKSVITSGDGAIHLWERDSGKELRRFEPNWAGKERPFFQAAALSKDGKRVAACWLDTTVRIWDVETGKEQRPILLGKDEAPAAGLAFSPDDRQLAIVSQQGGIRIWDFAAVKIVREFGPNPKDHSDGRRFGWEGTLAYAPDGKALVSIVTEIDKKSFVVAILTFWDPATGQVQRRLEELGKAGPRNPVFSPDGKLLAFCAENFKFLNVFDTASGRILFDHQYKGSGSVRHAVFSPDSRRLYFVPGLNQVIYEFDTSTGKLLREVGAAGKESDADVFRDNVYALALSPDGKWLGICDVGNSVRLVEIASGKTLPVAAAGHNRVLHYLAYSGDGKTVLSGAPDGTVHVWEAGTGQEIKMLSAAPPNNYRFVPTADGRYSVSLKSDMTALQLFDTEKQQVTRQIQNKRDKNASCIMSPNDQTLFVHRSSDGTIVLYDMPSLKERCRIVADTMVPLMQSSPDSASLWAQKLAFFFSPDGKRLAGRRDKTGLGVWDVATGKLLQQLKLPDQFTVEGGAFTLDGRVVALSLDNGSMPIFELASGGQRAVLGQTPNPKTPKGKENKAFRSGKFGRGYTVTDSPWLAISPDSRLLVTSCNTRSNALHLWDLAAGNELPSLFGHQGEIYSVAFGPDGNSVATGSVDGTALIWDLKGLRANTSPKSHDLGTAELQACWAALASDDAVAAYAAINQLTAGAKQTVPFVKNSLPAAEKIDSAQVAKLIGLLGSADYKTRQKATLDLISLGEQVLPYLINALAEKNPLETKQRLEALVKSIAGPPWTGEQLRAIRAVEVLERIGTPEARALMRSLSGGAPGALLTINAAAAIRRLGPSS